MVVVVFGFAWMETCVVFVAGGRRVRVVSIPGRRVRMSGSVVVVGICGLGWSGTGYSSAEKACAATIFLMQ